MSEKPFVNNKVLKAGAVVLLVTSTIAGGRVPNPSPSENLDESATTIPSPDKTSAYIEPYQPTQEDKTTFLTTLEKYLNLDVDFSLNDQFRVFPDDPSYRYTSSRHVATYTFGDIQLSIGKDEKGKVIEEILLLDLSTSKESLKIQPPHWEPIGPVNLNGEITYLGKQAEFSTAEGYTRINLFNKGQLEIIFRTTPFPK